MMSKRAQNFIGAVFANADDAHAVVKEMINHGFIMDQAGQSLYCPALYRINYLALNHSVL